MLNTISSFSNYFPTSHRVWSCLPQVKLPGIERVALIGLAFFAIYSLYRYFQPSSRADESEAIQSLSNRVETLEKEMAETTTRMRFLGEGLILAERKIQTLSHPSNANSVSIESLPITVPLELFKQQFPGAHLKVGNTETTLSDYLMKTLFRINDVNSCALNLDNTFILSYKEPKTVTITELPPSILDAIPWSLKWLLLPFLQMGPEWKISKNVQVEFIKTDQGTMIQFDAASIVQTANTLGYTSYLKSILILDNQDPLLHIQTEHNASLLPKNGSIPHEHCVALFQSMGL